MTIIPSPLAGEGVEDRDRRHALARYRLSSAEPDAAAIRRNLDRVLRWDFALAGICSPSHNIRHGAGPRHVARSRWADAASMAEADFCGLDGGGFPERLVDVAVDHDRRVLHGLSADRACFSYDGSRRTDVKTPPRGHYLLAAATRPRRPPQLFPPI